MICLHWLFSLANPDGGCIVSHLLFSSSPCVCFCSFFSDVDDLIRYLSRNLYQHGTITVNFANVYKVQSRAAGLCSPCLVLFRLCFLFFCTCFMCACVSVCVPFECVFKEPAVRVCRREELRVS